MTGAAIGPSAAELQDAIARYRAHLTPAELFDFDIAGLDRLGHAVVIAALAAPDGFANDGFGYGASFDEAAVGALGEMSETFHVYRALQTAPACEGLSYNAMVERFGVDHVIDPLTLCLPATSDYHADMPLRWVAVTRRSDGARAWTLRECIATSGGGYDTQSTDVVARTDAAPQRLFKPITCGLGAGLSLEQALSHGVLELLQRDGNCTRFRAMDQGIELELDTIADPGVAALLDELARHDIHVRAKVATTEFGLNNLYVIGEPNGPAAADDFPLMLTACGEAVHANRERALRKALLEYIAARVRKTFMHGPLAPIRALAPAAYETRIMDQAEPDDEEPRALDGMVAWLDKDPEELRALLADSVFARHETRAFSSLPSAEDMAVRDPADRMADLETRLGQAGLSVYYFDASPAGADAPCVVKSLVPGLEGETLSYYRVGERGVARLVREAPALAHIGAPRAGDVRVPLTAEAEARLGGPAYFNAEAADAVVGPLYPLYREPGSHTVQIARARRAG